VELPVRIKSLDVTSKFDATGIMASTMNIQKLKYWLLVILWMSFVFWMSARMFSVESISSVIVTIIRFTVHSFSAEQVHFTQWLIPKLGHVGEYFILGILLFRAFFAQSIKLQNWECSYYSTIVVILYSCSDELHQSLVYTRNTSLPDILIGVHPKTPGLT